MRRIIRAIYENGVLKPIDTIDLPEHETVGIEVVTPEDIPASGLVQIAAEGGSFDFLASPEEDVYTLADGEEV